MFFFLCDLEEDGFGNGEGGLVLLLLFPLQVGWPALPATFIILKGLCHEMNDFLKALKIRSLRSVYAPIALKFFYCLVMENITNKVFTSFYENT